MKILELILEKLASADLFDTQNIEQIGSLGRNLQLEHRAQAKELLQALHQAATARMSKFENANNPIDSTLENPGFTDENGDSKDSAPLSQIMDVLIEAVWRFRVREQAPLELQAVLLAAIEQMYRWSDRRGSTRSRLLNLLTSEESEPALRLFTQLLIEAPPVRMEDVGLALAGLFQAQKINPEWLMPRLLDGLEKPSIAGGILDWCNFLVHQKKVSRHPATERSAQLAGLLGGLVGRLHSLQEAPEQFGDSPRTIAGMVAESLGLVTALCNALGLIGDRQYEGKLRQAMELSHRRIRLEAAAALARMGEEAGWKELTEMASDPATRTRALAYLEELSGLDRVAAENRSELARAEGEMVLWLSGATQFGMPPQSIQLIDQRRQYWPGFDDPIDCYLFRFEYVLHEGKYSGIGIFGPLTFALHADLEDLPPNDLYAVYAGWQAEHEEIRQWSAEELSTEQEIRWQEVREHLLDEEYEAIELVKIGRFFGQEQFILTAMRKNIEGILVVVDSREEWHPKTSSRRPMEPEHWHWHYNGRELLRTFNP